MTRDTASSAAASILASLNSAQRRAVTSDASTVAILAGPGSGKTHTLTSRVVWLLDERGYAPEDVVVATFTVKAAREMKERIGRALGRDGRERRLVLGTFHSIARRYLAAYGARVGLDRNFAIADDADSRAILARIHKRLRLGVEPAVARAWISKRKAKGTGTERPSGRSRSRTRTRSAEEDLKSRDLETYYDEYQGHLKKSNLLDYDDLLVLSVELLRKVPACVRNVQAVLIDEYQDTNGVQYELMKLFAQARQRITVVGDPDQSIYGWRSAEIRNLYRLLREFPSTAEVALEENYRSSSSILTVSLVVIQQDKDRYQKVLKPVHQKGTRPVLRQLRTPAKEAEWIVAEIKRALMMSGQMLTHDDIAILLRSASLSRHVESALGKEGIAYRMVGGFKFYERVEIKVLLDYLRAINLPRNNDALARIINVPKRGIGDATVKALIEEAERSSMSLWDVLEKHCRGDRAAKTTIIKRAEQNISGGLLRLIRGIRDRKEPFKLVELIDHLVAKLSFKEFLKETYTNDHEQRWANVEEFRNLASDFAKGLESGIDDALPEIDGLLQEKESDVLPRFLANVSLASDAQKDDGEEAKPTVTVSTIHAAKGLEWPIVFVPAVYTGSIPHARSEDLSEERRLLYVAMTRAQALLYLSSPTVNSNGDRVELSQFVEPAKACFAPQGPSFERQMINEMAHILRRDAPSEEDIYKKLPPGFCPQDDLFPLDPNEDRSLGRENREDGGKQHVRGARSKRPPRMQAASTSASGSARDQGAPEEWMKGYATTMQQADSFTVATHGFTSAGAHHVTMSAHAAAEAAREADQRAAKKRAHNQQSLMGMGFVGGAAGAASPLAQPPRHGATHPRRGPHTASATDGNLDPPPRQVRPPHQPLRSLHNLPQQQQPQRPAIDPALAAHKLGSAALPRPAAAAARTKRPAGEEDGDDGRGPRKRYACFSSSPPRPEAAAPARPGEEDGAEGGGEPARPAACFHATTTTAAAGTTMMMPKGLRGGLKRPAGLGRAGIAPVQRVNRPFRPLTIKRP